MNVFTIGVYGFNDKSFMDALTSHHIDVVIDIRRRRGVRGPLYAFANSQRLQDELKSASIRYVHALDLAPPESLIHMQMQHDTEHGGKVRDRSDLLPAFRQAYISQTLDTFDFDSFFKDNGIESGNICLLCVERTAEACHRGMIATRLREKYGWPVTNLEP